MRTLQEKYNAIQEGNFSKEHFLAEARMQQPQLITRFNGYDDAVQILKNRGMIAEAKVNTETLKETNNSTPDFKAWMALHKNNQKGFAAELEKVGLDQSTPPSLAFKRLDDKQKEKVYSNVAVNAASSKGIKEAKQTKLTKKSLTDYRYKPTNDMDKYPYEQILRGLRVELEALEVLGTPTAEEYSKALAKVSKNLEKDSIYYTNQVAGVSPKVDLHDKMVTATAKNTVDTFNGMKKAALKEGFKKLIKKVLSEDAGIASRGIEYSQPTKDEYEFYTNPEKYKDKEEDEFELQEDEEADDFFEGQKSLSELLK